ncbi:zinc ribbon domain-containing protein [Haladaptatus sp. DYF46]|uniref:zinc ribbon domain-containing protein n=1 Tax=Haladaptatus sp. DYF46 TaxID=2886041 RepID=UPI001E385347|nr:zinc ribbon domain-containing protein [Haladaptatus sp. DYF46]
MENPLVAAGIALVFFGIGSFFGQIGIIIAGLMLIAIGSSSQSGGDSTDPADKANCPSCGARNDPENVTCHHCGTVLSEE